MRARDDLRKRVLRMAMAAIKLAEVDKSGALDEAAVMGLLQKEIKSRQEALEEATSANRPDLAADAQAEIAVLQTYLPQPFTPQELEALARQVIAELGADSPRQMGAVMKVLVPRLEGRATGGEANQVVRKLLG